MPSAGWIRVVVALAAAVMFGAAAVSGDGSFGIGQLRLVGAATSAVTLVLLVYDRWAWRWPLLRRVAESTGTPVVHGTWSGTIQSREQDGSLAEPLDCYLVVRQTYSSLRIQTMFEHSVSQSLTARIVEETAGARAIVTVYRSANPPTAHQEVSPAFGGSRLTISGSPVEAISGAYWNERRLRGDLKFAEHTPKVLDSLDRARSAYKARA